MKTFQEMEDAFYTETRQELLAGLEQLAPGNHRIFKLMYAEPARTLTVAEKEGQSIQQVVANMPSEKLDWAMQQVQRTIEKAQKAERPEPVG